MSSNGNTKRCPCGCEQFYVLRLAALADSTASSFALSRHMGIEQTHGHPNDPRAPAYEQVIEQLECAECGATYSA